MNFNQLANLIKAGFNEEQIRSIGSIMDTGTSTNTGTNTGTNTNTPAPTTTALQTPPVTPAPTSDPATPPATPPATGGTLASAAQSTTPPAESGGTDKAGESETVTLLKEMLGIIQKGNINTVGTGAAAQETGVDVLAEVLNPTPKTK